MRHFRLPAVFRPTTPVSTGVRRISTGLIALVLLGILLVGTTISAATIVLVGKQKDGSVVVPTNQVLRPAGTSTLLSQRPVDIALRPDGKQIAAMTTDLTFLIDPATGKVTQGIEKDDRSVAGLAYSPDGTHLYYSKGASHGVSVVAIDANGKATIEGNIDTGDKTWPSGLSISPDGKTLYVALFGTNSMGVVDLTAKKLTKTVPVGSSPFGSFVSPDGKFVYTSNWGGSLPKAGEPTDPIFPVKINPVTGASANGTLSVYDVTAGQSQSEIVVGLHPTAITFDKNSTRLFVTNSNEDTVSVLDLTKGNSRPELERILVRPDKNLPFGSMPNGLTLDKTGKTLYVANGGNNAIALITLGSKARPVSLSATADTEADASANAEDRVQKADAASKIKGFVPTEWFPVGVVLSPDNKQFYVASNKGEGSINNLPSYESKSVFNLTGSVSTVVVPDGAKLTDYTKQVLDNSQYLASLASSVKAPRPDAKPVPVPQRVGEPSVFKHVIYVIKENRTYDQVFGDIGKGNSDPKITQFPNNVSPNHHLLANRFGLLDNFYASSVNSADGHQWTDEAIGNVFAERVYGLYPTNNPAGITSYGNSSLDLPPDSLWSNAVGHKISFRNYGEDGANTVLQKQSDGTYKPITNLNWLDIYNNWKNKGDKYKFQANAITPPLFLYEDHNYPAFDTNITDQIRADEWEREFNDFVKNKNLPQLEVVWLPDDHTSGVRTGLPTPSAQVADNDLALGRMIDTLSHSPYWQDTVVFVVEDDAQNGVDHVDGHRTVGLTISAYNKSGAVDSTLYNQTSMVRTIEQILGLPPMNQFDLTAPLMDKLFTSQPDLTPYNRLANQIPLDQLTGQPVAAASSQVKADIEASNQMIFTVPDVNKPDVLNSIVWRATMGDRPYPAFDWQKYQKYVDTDGDGGDPDGDGY